MMLLSVDFSNLHTILETLYDEMLPLCEDMMDVGKGIAGLGALFYVAVRVWQSLARAEPVDVYPLLRPFALGICILLFPTLVLGTMNSVLGLVVQGTHRMLEGQTLDMEKYREQKDRLEYEIKMSNPETAYLVSDEEFDRQIDELGWGPADTAAKIGMYAEWAAYQTEKLFRDGIRYLLELLFAAASLLIDTVRTSTLSQWFMRYISVYLWLPVSDLFSCMLAKMQVLMLQKDILELQTNPDYSLDTSDSVYLIFMIIAIFGYFTIPTVAGWIVQAGGAGNYMRNLNRQGIRAGGFAAGMAGAAAGNVGGRIGKAIRNRFKKK